MTFISISAIIRSIMKEHQELKFGDGGYSVDDNGDIRPFEDVYEYEDSSVEKNSEQQEKLDEIYNTYGFYPKSATEMASIVGIESSRNRDAAKYLSSIMLHQESLPIAAEDPTVTGRTAKKITNDFIRYRDDSRANATFLKDLRDEASRAVEDGKDRMSQSELSDISIRAAIQIDRKLSTDDFIRNGPTDEKFKFGEDSEYRGKRLENFLEFVDPKILMHLSESVNISEINRLNYWTERIAELTKVTTVQEMAHRAINRPY